MRRFIRRAYDWQHKVHCRFLAHGYWCGYWCPIAPEGGES